MPWGAAAKAAWRSFPRHPGKTRDPWTSEARLYWTDPDADGWVPAFAGMTDVDVIALSVFVIPAKAGIHGWRDCVPDSGIAARPEGSAFPRNDE
jgi:hypothetical protein